MWKTNADFLNIKWRQHFKEFESEANLNKEQRLQLC